MKATEKLHELGQSLWLDNITREMLDSGTLQQYSDDYSVTGLTLEPCDLQEGDRRPGATVLRPGDRGPRCQRLPNFGARMQRTGTPVPADGGHFAKTLAEFANAGVDVDALAAKLQSDAATGFVDAWNDLMAHIDEQSAALRA